MSGDVHVRFRERLGVRFPRATRLVIGFERRDDAERVMDVLPKRLGRYGLTLHADKTRLLPFGRPPRRQQGGKGPASFDFLGFTLHWRRARSGRWGMWCKTRSSRVTIPYVSHNSPLPAFLTRWVAMPSGSTVALAAVVTQEGALSHVKLLRGGAPDGDLQRAISRLVSDVRFMPARYGGVPVAVNVVWLLERTTVRAAPISSS